MASTPCAEAERNDSIYEQEQCREGGAKKDHAATGTWGCHTNITNVIDIVEINLSTNPSI